MLTNKTQLHLTIADLDADTEQVDKLTCRLIRELRDLGAESVKRMTNTEAPEYIKGDVFTLGALSLVALPAFLPKLVEFLQAWTLRGENRTVRVKTSAGLEVEFTPENQLSQDDILDLVRKLEQTQSI
jgi:hypothetical protein